MSDIEKKWWQEKAIYQIYPRSFCDSNGDGIGDIPGIISKLDYLQDLGIGAIWLSPVYKSPNADYGYDISDYYDINPEYGTLDDMKRLIAEADQRDIKIIMDLVINHTSDEHPWFIQSRNPESPYRDYYIWKNGKTDQRGRLQPPNNWESLFTGSAWQKDDASGQYYLHLFDKKQPDLNFRNPKVVEEVKKIMNFWLDQGVAGFRCDVINLIYKQSFADGRPSLYERGREHYLSTPGCHKIIKEFQNEVLGPRGAFTVGEILNADLESSRKFIKGELDVVFSPEHISVDQLKIPLLRAKYQPEKMKKVLTKWQKGLIWNSLFFENHDGRRSLARFGNVEKYRQPSAKMLATILLTLRGTPFIYQGEEIGMTDFPFRSIDEMRDVTSRNVYKILRGYRMSKRLAFKLVMNFCRDHARTPMQWDYSSSAGFTSGRPWLPVNPNYYQINVEESQEDKDSILHYYRTLLSLRNQTPVLQYGGFVVLDGGKNIFAYQRECEGERYLVVANMDKKPHRAKVALAGDLILSNYNRTSCPEHGRLEPYETLILRQK